MSGWHTCCTCQSRLHYTSVQHIFRCLSAPCVCLCVWLSVCPSVCLSVCVSACPFCLSIRVAPYRVQLSLSVCWYSIGELCINLSVSLSIKCMAVLQLGATRFPCAASGQLREQPQGWSGGGFHFFSSPIWPQRFASLQVLLNPSSLGGRFHK